MYFWSLYQKLIYRCSDLIITDLLHDQLDNTNVDVYFQINMQDDLRNLVSIKETASSEEIKTSVFV